MANEGDEPLLGSDLILTSLVQLQSKDHEEILNVIGGLADDIVRAIATEDENSKLERERLTWKLKTLKSCLEQLHRLDRHNISGKMYERYGKLKANGH